MVFGYDVTRSVGFQRVFYVIGAIVVCSNSYVPHYELWRWAHQNIAFFWTSQTFLRLFVGMSRCYTVIIKTALMLLMASGSNVLVVIAITW